MQSVMRCVRRCALHWRRVAREHTHRKEGTGLSCKKGVSDYLMNSLSSHQRAAVVHSENRPGTVHTLGDGDLSEVATEKPSNIWTNLARLGTLKIHVCIQKSRAVTISITVFSLCAHFTANCKFWINLHILDHSREDQNS